MTKKVALFVDNGGEELELIAPLDIMRRANLEVDLISANNAEYVTGAHNIKIITDKKIDDIKDILEYDAIVIPGGMPGSTLLRGNKKISKTITSKNNIIISIFMMITYIIITKKLQGLCTL